jgi:DNA-binding GntR family transcriptional regulator
MRDRIHLRLRRAILQGELAPGTPVIEAELAQQLGSSRTPVREALRRLESEGLLEPRGLRGTVVRAVDRDEVECIFEVREALESLAARRAARRLSDDDLRALEADVAGMRAALDDPEEMERHDTAFHDRILASARGEVLARTLSELRDQLITYRFLSLSDADRRRQTVEEHEAILAALRARDAASAALRTAEHIAAARTAVQHLESPQ